LGERKETKQFFFTVEGETEQWYLLWLRDKINSDKKATYKVSIVPKVQQSPLKFAKGVTAKSVPRVVHICDIESNDDVHVQKFQRILSELKEAKKAKGISYGLGYSNFTFELWMVLHKKNCNGPLNVRTQYLNHINQAYGEHFENLEQYKHENYFKRCLEALELADVREAIRRAKSIMEKNKTDGKQYIQYKGFKYYKENPALTIYEAVEGILLECGLDY